MEHPALQTRHVNGWLVISRCHTRNTTPRSRTCEDFNNKPSRFQKFVRVVREIPVTADPGTGDGLCEPLQHLLQIALDVPGSNDPRSSAKGPESVPKCSRDVRAGFGALGASASTSGEGWWKSNFGSARLLFEDKRMHS